jgi:hypothetical protein
LGAPEKGSDVIVTKNPGGLLRISPAVDEDGNGYMPNVRRVIPHDLDAGVMEPMDDVESRSTLSSLQGTVTIPELPIVSFLCSFLHCDTPYDESFVSYAFRGCQEKNGEGET